MPDNPDIDREPNFHDGNAEPDPSEKKAQRNLERHRSNADAAEEAAWHSIYDEPAIFPRQSPQLIDRNWSCSRCGCNLRGLEVGNTCPECNHVGQYGPPPPDKPSYTRWIQQKRRQTRASDGWITVAVIGLMGGPWAVLGAAFTGQGTLAAIFYGPAAEEMMKIAVAALVVERWPYRVRLRVQIVAAVILSALGFAVIENLLYLNVYIPRPPPDLIAWRWVICTGLHVGCTTIAALGLAKVWHRTVTELRRPRLAAALPWIIVAIVIHGAYNAFVFVLQLTEYQF